MLPRAPSSHRHHPSLSLVRSAFHSPTKPRPATSPKGKSPDGGSGPPPPPRLGRADRPHLRSSTTATSPGRVGGPLARAVERIVPPVGEPLAPLPAPRRPRRTPKPRTVARVVVPTRAAPRVGDPVCRGPDAQERRRGALLPAVQDAARVGRFWFFLSGFGGPPRRRRLVRLRLLLVLLLIRLPPRRARQSAAAGPGARQSSRAAAHVPLCRDEQEPAVPL